MHVRYALLKDHKYSNIPFVLNEKTEKTSETLFVEIKKESKNESSGDNVHMQLA